MRASRSVSVALAAMAFACVFVTGTPTPAATEEDFNCPADCHCVVPPHTHTRFLHAKCSSINGLLGPVHATLPIHSVDLSFLGLSRLSHALDHLHDLTSVDLSHNELHEIGHLGRRIKKLNLKHNRLTSSKLAKMPQHVQVLNLQHNDITTLPLELTKLSQLHTLELSHNAINCTCETLEVRNWLQERHVFMEHPVVCSYPAVVRGQSWLQVKQPDICQWEKEHSTPEDDENEVMLGDQPVEGSGDNEDVDELNGAFIRVDGEPKAAKLSSAKSAELLLNDVEGSGDLGEIVAHRHSALATERPLELTTEADDEEDGSGSGGGPLIIPHDIFLSAEEEEAPRTHHDEVDGADKPAEHSGSSTTISPQIFGGGMGIFDGGDKSVEEQPIVPVVHSDLGSEVVTEGTDGDQSADIKTASTAQKDDSNATYFLLGVIGLIVVGLILFVGIKRCKANSGGHDDAENPRQTELLDMDKKQLGKPIHHNGAEHAPLIGEKTKADMAKPVNGTKPYDSLDMKENGGAGQQPLLNGNGTSNGNGSGPHDADELPKGPSPHEYYPISPRYPTPQSPRASKYAQREKNNNNVEDSYMPASPKAGRYSPVYSPETGRVKIKLTETPRPKTPMLVTRSKSNAGDIITTPVHLNNVDGAGQVRATPIATNGHVNY